MSGRARIAVALVAVALVAVVLAGVVAWLALGGGGSAGGGSGAGAPVVVVADSGLRAPLTQYAKLFGTERAKGVLTEALHKAEPGTTKASLTFAATAALAARIRKGARPDVIAGDSPVLDALYAAGLVQEPITIATARGDELTLFKRQGNTRINRFEDVLKPGVRLAIVTPATARARVVLGRLPAAQRRALLANARLREPDAAAVIKRVADKTADAGIVFGSDLAKAHAATGLDTDPPTYVVGLPGYLQLPFAKSVAIVNGTKNQLAANAFIYGLIDGNSAAETALQGSGFTPDPPITHRPPKPPPVKQGDV